MPENYEKQTFTDSEGNEVEAVPADQVDQVLQEKEEELKTEKEKLESELEEKKNELENMSDKDKNFKELRDTKENLEKKLQETQETYDKEIQNLKEQQSQKDREETINAMVGDDKDTKDKINYHLDNTVSAMPEDTEENRKKKIEAAYRLSVDSSGEGGKPGSAFNTSSGGGNEGGQGEKKPEVDNLKDIAGKFGLSEEDLNNYM